MSRKSELYYEEIGDDFDAFMSDFDVERRGVLINELIPDQEFGRTLEVGCGTGAITRTYRSRVGDLLTTDISEKLALRTAEQNQATGQRQDATQLDLDDDTFDLVVSSECIEHCPEPARAVGEMIRVLKPGGYLVLTTPNRLWQPVVTGAQKMGLRSFQGNEVFLGVRELRSAASAAGADVLRQTGCHLFPWQLPGVKPILRRLDAAGDRLVPFMINQAILAQKRS